MMTKIRTFAICYEKSLFSSQPFYSKKECVLLKVENPAFPCTNCLAENIL